MTETRAFLFVEKNQFKCLICNRELLKKKKTKVIIKKMEKLLYFHGNNKKKHC